jgi:hypothetical protein
LMTAKDVRKAWIRRQCRDILPAEIREFEQAEHTLRKLSETNAQTISHPVHSHSLLTLLTLCFVLY